MYLVYVTAPEDEAGPLARSLVEMRLCAGVNIVPAVRSVYRWRNEVREKGECLLLIQSPKEKFADLQAYVAQKHSYLTPCVFALEMADGYRPFIEWVGTCG